jgi:hypothetical protein
MYTTTRVDVSPLAPTMTFHACFGSAFIIPRPVAAVRDMVEPRGPVHHYSLVKWENRISVYDEDNRHVVKALRWDVTDTAGAMEWFHQVHGRTLNGRKVQVTFKGRWA